MKVLDDLLDQVQEEHMVKILAYKGTDKYSWIIRLFTKGKYDHVAFLLPTGHIADSRPKGFDLYLSHAMKHCQCDIYKIKAPLHQHEKLKSIIRHNAGMWEYDWPGVVGYGLAKIFDLKKYWHSKTRLFCSEAVITFLRQAGIKIYAGYEPNEIDPGKLMEHDIFEYQETIDIP